MEIWDRSVKIETHENTYELKHYIGESFDFSFNNLDEKSMENDTKFENEEQRPKFFVELQENDENCG